jgi:hypothetical protein
MAVTITRTANPAGVSASANVATYTAASIGTAAPNRIVVVVVASERASTPIASCTIDGNAMTAGTAGNFGAVYARCFYLLYPTGTTANIAVTFTTNSPTSTQNHIAVYTVTDGVFSSSGGDGSTDMDATDPLTTGSTTIGTGGGMIAVAGGASDTTAKSWTNLTEDLDVDAGALRFTTATSITAGTATRTCQSTLSLEDGALAWMIFADNAEPTVVLNSPADTASTGDLTPTLNFTGTDADSDSVEYEVQIHTDNTFSTQIASDDFNRADGGLGGNWTNYSGGGFGTPTITSNAVNSGADNFDAPAYWSGAGTFTDDQYSQATITFGDTGGGSSYAGLILRAGATSWIQVQRNPATGWTEAYDVTSTGGSYAFLGSENAPIADGSVVRAEVIGDQVYVYDDGVLILQKTTTLTTGKPGILPNDDTDIIDNWSAGNISPLIDALSSTDAGFTAGHPFASAAAIDYTVQSDLTDTTTYYWRVRAIDPAGSNTWGAWATTISFTATAPSGGTTYQGYYSSSGWF